MTTSTVLYPPKLFPISLSETPPIDDFQPTSSSDTFYQTHGLNSSTDSPPTSPDIHPQPLLITERNDDFLHAATWQNPPMSTIDNNNHYEGSHALHSLTADDLNDTEALASKLKTVCLSLSKGFNQDLNISALADLFNRKLCDNDDSHTVTRDLSYKNPPPGLESTSRKFHISNKSGQKNNESEKSTYRSLPERGVRLNDFSVLCANLITSLLNLGQAEHDWTNGGIRTDTLDAEDRQRKRVQTFRRVLHELQSLWLINTSMATGATVKTQTELRTILMAATFILGLIPDILRGLMPVFFTVMHESNGSSEGFINYLSHWGGTGYVQYLYEVCIMLLVHNKQYALVLLSLSGIGEMEILRKLLGTKALNIINKDQGTKDFSHALGLDGVTACRREIMACLKFPVHGFEFLIQHYVEMKDEEITLGLMALSMSRGISEQIFIHNIWQKRLMERLRLNPAHMSNADVFALLSMASYKDNEDVKISSICDIMTRVVERTVPKFIYQRNVIDIMNFLTTTVKERLMNQLYLSECRQRLAMVMEIAHRIVERYWIGDMSQNPVADLLSDMSNNEEKRLQMCKRAMNGLIGSSLGRIDLLYMRLLENFDQQFSGCTSGFIGLDFTNKGPLPFTQVLTLNDATFMILLKSQQELYLNNDATSSSSMVRFTNLTLPPLPVVLPSNDEIWRQDELSKYQANRWLMPTVLPLHISESFPSLLAGFHVMTSDGHDNGQVMISEMGWKLLAFEMLIAASHRPGINNSTGYERKSLLLSSSQQIVNSVNGVTVPCRHLNLKILAELLPHYIDVRNPRAIYLLSRLTNLDEEDRVATENTYFLENLFSFFQEMLIRAEKCGFSLIADAMIDLVSLEEANEQTYFWCTRILNVYEASKEQLKARNFIQSIPNTILFERLQKESKVWNFEPMNINARVKEDGPMKEDRVKKALKMIKKLGAVKDVDAIMKFFHELRHSNGGITDASLLNKILHLCVANNRYEEADQIFQCLRTEAHENVNGVDFTTYRHGLASVRPDVVTCNIVLKGLVKQMLSKNRDDGRLVRISHLVDYFIKLMEAPFWMGGEGVKADSITFNIAIGFAVDQDDIEEAWNCFKLMCSKGIRVDVYTCNLIINRLDLKRDAHIATALVDILDQFKINGEDSACLSSLVEAFSKLKEWKRLETILNKYELCNSNKEMTSSSMIMLFKGYSYCKNGQKLRHIWNKLKQSTSVRWNGSIISLILDAFTATGDNDAVLEVIEVAVATNTPLPGSRSGDGLVKGLTPPNNGKDRCRALQLNRHQHDQNSSTSSRSNSPEAKTYNNNNNSQKKNNDEILSWNDNHRNTKIKYTLQHSVRSGNFEGAWKLLEMNKSSDVKADIVLYSTIIKGLCEQEKIVLARTVFESIPKEGYEYDSVIFNTMLEGYAKIGDSKNVEEILNAFLQSSCPPTCYTMTILFKYYGRLHMIEEVINIMETLPALYPIKLDSYVYTAAIAACAWNNRLEDALKYLVDMKREHEVGLRTYGTMISGSLKCQNWQVLKQVLGMAKEDRCQLDKRELNGLSDLLRSYKTGRMAKGWLNTGFGKPAAEMIHLILSAQKPACKGMSKGMKVEY